VPVWSIIIQAVWSSLLAVSGSYDQLTDYVIFASWIFYGMTTSAVLVLRRTMPDAPRPYKTLGYPLIPLVFVLVALGLIVNTLVARPVESATGLIVIALGLPVFLYCRHQRNQNRER
jgi:APA family basic amino acid/polyamine antiporter